MCGVVVAGSATTSMLHEIHEPEVEVAASISLCVPLSVQELVQTSSDTPVTLFSRAVDLQLSEQVCTSSQTLSDRLVTENRVSYPSTSREAPTAIM